MTTNTGPVGTAIVLQRIVPKDGVNAGDLENLILHDVFASVDTSGGEGTPDEHTLLDDGAEYIWMSRLEYFMHATPTPAWLTDRVDDLHKQAHAKLDAMATLPEEPFHYDVGAWRHHLGF